MAEKLILKETNTYKRPKERTESFDRSKVHSQIVIIYDPDPIDLVKTLDRLHAQRQRLLEVIYAQDRVQDATLLAPVDERSRAIQRLKSVGVRSVLIDISSFPKCWFSIIAQAVTAGRPGLPRGGD